MPATVALQPGTRFGPYEVTSLIGSGGMGEVYRARDTKLGRDVAVKILPAAFAGDPDRAMRFEREARTLASLNHPHIAAIYGLETNPSTGSGQGALVMELVEGEDLSARIARGPIALKEALAIARQIAEALEAAHDLGIIHRDLKPANVKLKEDGTVKVLDFGLAKALAGAPDAVSGSGDSPATSPTMTSPALTQMGLILGTAAYMSPEQAKGKAADRRADVWAFGVVLYEMLTGKRLFDRPDVSETFAAVLTAEPDFSKLPPATPGAIRQLLARCLTRDKKQRLDSMTAARLDLDEAQHARPEAAPTTSRRQLSWTLAFVLLFVAFGSGWLVSRFLTARPAASPSVPPLIAEIPPPLGVVSAFSHGFALSPDGQTLVFFTRTSTGVIQLWTRRLGATDATPLAGTEDGRFPFWSPDGAHIAFFAAGKLRRVPAAGGASQAICDAAGSFTSGSWNRNDEILFGTSTNVNRIWKVAAAGGTPERLDALGSALAPVWLPDGRLLYATPSGTAGIGVLTLSSLDGSAKKEIARLDAIKSFAYAADGSYVLLNRNEVLTAQKLDLQTSALTGPIVTLAGIAGTPVEWFSVSAAGDRLVAAVKQSPAEVGNPGDPWAKLEWVTRAGQPAGSVGDRGHYWTLALSPDGRRVATNPSQDIWILETANGRRSRATSGPINEHVPVWSPDSAEILYRADNQLWRMRIDPLEPAKVLKDSGGTPHDWGRDGRVLLQRTGESTKADIWIYELTTSTSKPWLATPFSERQPRFSPDGQWIAYVSDASGRAEVYLKRADGTGGPIPISNGGGLHPQFRRDGRELYYIGPADALMAVSLTPGPSTVVAGDPNKLFTALINDVTIGSYAPYAVTADGQKFLINAPDRPSPLFFLHGLTALVDGKR